MMRPSALLLAATVAFAPFAAHAESAVTIPPPAAEAPTPDTGLETAVLAGGCFWGIQAVYQHVKGVTNAVSGYAGGGAITEQLRIDRVTQALARAHCDAMINLLPAYRRAASCYP